MVLDGVLAMRRDPFEEAAKAFEDRVEELERQIYTLRWWTAAAVCAAFIAIVL